MQFEAKIELSLPKRLKVNADDMLRAQGVAAAKHIRERVARGEDADGKMPPSVDQDGQHPRMNKTGRWLKSIKRRGGKGQPHRVQATGLHDRGVRNAAISAIQVAKDQHDIFGMDSDLEEKLSKVGDRSLTKQLAKGEARLITELKRIKV